MGLNLLSPGSDLKPSGHKGWAPEGNSGTHWREEERKDAKPYTSPPSFQDGHKHQRMISEATTPMWVRISPSTDSVKELEFGRIISQAEHYHPILVCRKFVEGSKTAWQIEGALSMKFSARDRALGMQRKKSKRDQCASFKSSRLHDTNNKKEGNIATKKTTQSYILNRKCTKRGRSYKWHMTRTCEAELQGQSSLQILSWNRFNKSMLLSQGFKSLFLNILVVPTLLFSYLCKYLLRTIF